MNEQLKNKLLSEYKKLLNNYTGSKEKFITYVVNQNEINSQFEGLAEVLKEGLYSYETADLQNTQSLEEIENTQETQNDTTETTNNNETSTSVTSTSY